MLLLDGQDVLNPEENGLLQDEPRIEDYVIYFNWIS